MTDLPAPDAEPLRSVHTSNFPALLQQLGASLAITTYQAGKLVLARADGDSLNTHFRVFTRPMGMALRDNRLALGSGPRLWEFRNVPAAAPKLVPPDKHDACFLPRQSHITGDIDIHEMAFAGDTLWFVNTRFSCLCTHDVHHSFMPRWRPPFVSAYAPEDRCHLNGLAVVDDQPRYVTALGTADSVGGWRDNKARGGVLMDIRDNRIVTEGLSMPHSPRWYRDRLWVLESGEGSLATLDPATGERTVVAELPGFTRGLDFLGPLAFVGLSQVRESAVFSGIPLTERLSERICGVWVVNIESGETVAFLRFEDAVTEVFAVQVLPGMRFPELVVEDGELLQSTYVLPDAALAETVVSETPLSEAQRCFQAATRAYQDRDLAGAVAQLQRGLTLAPREMTARFQLGVILVDLGRFQEAIGELRQVIGERPDHAEAHNSLGVAFLRTGDQAKALWHIQRAVRLRPDFAIARQNLQVLRGAGGESGDSPG